ncbi:MAG: hypothetical protein Tsb005_00630 [Gammaproteobacteria bacterium]
MNIKPAILIVDDREENLIALEALIKQLEQEVTIVKSLSANDALAKLLYQKFALILLDVQMPNMDGFEMARLVKRKNKTANIPIIFLTAHDPGCINQMFGYNAGAVDYLTKPINSEILLAKVKVFLDLYLLQAELEYSQQRFTLALQASNNGIWDWDLLQNTVFYSDYLLEQLEYYGGAKPTNIEFLKHLICKPFVDKFENALTKHLSNDEKFYVECQLHLPSGQKRWFLFKGQALWDEQNQPMRMSGSLTDIEERMQATKRQRELEKKLTKAKKIESIGKLTGGIAHEFNNLLFSIKGNLQLIQHEIAASNPNKKINSCMITIEKAIDKAKNLITQMLDFAREANFQKTPVNLNSVVTEAVELLKNKITHDVKVEKQLADQTLILEGDSGQLLRALYNLGLNGAQAISDKGQVTFSTHTIMPDEKFCEQYPQATQQPYAKICVKDTGCGIPEMIEEQVFDPFFTTRDVTEGVGLGLSIVHGCITKHNGWLTLNSIPEQGVEITIYLPLFTENNAATLN